MLSACIYDPMEKMGWSPEYIAYAAKHEGKKLLGGSKQWQTALTPEQQEIKAAELKERLPGLTKAQLLQRLGPPDVQYNYHSASGEMMEWKTVNDTDESMLWDIGGSASVCAFMKHGVCGGTGIWPQVYGR